MTSRARNRYGRAGADTDNRIRALTSGISCCWSLAERQARCSPQDPGDTWGSQKRGAWSAALPGTSSLTAQARSGRIRSGSPSSSAPARLACRLTSRMPPVTPTRAPPPLRPRLPLGTALITTAESAREPASSPTTTYMPSTSTSTPDPIAGSTLWAPGPDGRAVSCGTNDARVHTPACDHAWHITDGNG